MSLKSEDSKDHKARKGNVQVAVEYAQYLKDLKDDRRGKKPILAGPDIFYRYRGAVVALETSTQLMFDDFKSNVTNAGSGFFIGNGYIVTSAQLVLLDTANRVPPAPTPPAPFISRVNKIVARVTAVNGDPNVNLIYEAELVGVDPAANIALLRISARMNPGLPQLNECQAYFKFDPSRLYAIGRKVYAICASQQLDSQFITDGVVTNNRQFSTGPGYPPVELVMTSLDLDFPLNIGSPIINEYGHVIGVITVSYPAPGETFAGGISEFFLKPILESLLNPLCNRQFVSLVNDSEGPYYRRLKGYLGIAWSPFTIDDWSPEFNRPGYKRNQGVVVRAIDPSTQLGQLLLPLIIQGNTILITDIDGCEIGNIPPQVTPAIITWRCGAGTEVVLKYRVSSDDYAKCLSLKVVLSEFPIELDNPFFPVFMSPKPPTEIHKPANITDSSTRTSSAVVDVKHVVATTGGSGSITDVKDVVPAPSKPAVHSSGVKQNALQRLLGGFKRAVTQFKVVNATCMSCKQLKACCDACGKKEYLL
jgi:S1-C subfamily serine protease